jgi:muconolactone delta-isomerase
MTEIHDAYEKVDGQVVRVISFYPVEVEDGHDFGMKEEFKDGERTILSVIQTRGKGIRLWRKLTEGEAYELYSWLGALKLDKNKE